MYDNDIPQNSRIDPDWSSVPDGTPVLTNDGQRLGTVTRKLDDGLLVKGDAGQDSDYMVTAADIGSIGDDGVHLIVSQQQAMKAHWQGTSPSDQSAPGGMAPGAMTREQNPPTV